MERPIRQAQGRPECNRRTIANISRMAELTPPSMQRSNFLRA